MPRAARACVDRGAACTEVFLPGALRIHHIGAEARGRRIPGAPADGRTTRRDAATVPHPSRKSFLPCGKKTPSTRALARRESYSQTIAPWSFAGGTGAAVPRKNAHLRGTASGCVIVA